jgi:hypothetical protein
MPRHTLSIYLQGFPNLVLIPIHPKSELFNLELSLLDILLGFDLGHCIGELVLAHRWSVFGHHVNSGGRTKLV